MSRGPPLPPPPGARPPPGAGPGAGAGRGAGAGARAGGGGVSGLAGPAALAVGLMAAACAEPALAAALPGEAAAQVGGARGHEVALLASQDPSFAENMVRYTRYMVTLLAGTGYVILKPLGRFLKTPATAIPFVLGTVLTIYLVKFTLEAMLGLSGDPLGGPVGGGLSAL